MGGIGWGVGKGVRRLESGMVVHELGVTISGDIGRSSGWGGRNAPEFV